MTFFRFGASMPATMKNVIAFLGVAAVCLTGCHHPPPPAPPPPPPPPPVVVAPPPPPPAPAKCEALSEGCTGRAVARIRSLGWSLTVPDGWAYAQEEDATVVTRGEAIMAITTFGGWPDPKLSETYRLQALERLIYLLGVSPPRNPVAWVRPVQKRRGTNLEMSLWQADNVTKGMRKGPVLVFGAELPDHRWILGAAFVPDDDNTDADKTIVGAVDTIAPSPAAP
jgi:hypothetical protein